MKYKYQYRELTEKDLKTIASKRHAFYNCKGLFYGLENTKQAVIITDAKLSNEIEKKLTKRNAQKIARIDKENNKTFLLIQCGNIASIKAYCKRKEITAPIKIKRNLGLNDILIKQPQTSQRVKAKTN